MRFLPCIILSIWCGAEGAISSVVIDAAFAYFVGKFAPGARVTDALVGCAFKRSVDNALQNGLNFGAHKAADAIWESWESNPSNIPLEMGPEKFSSIRGYFAGREGNDWWWACEREGVQLPEHHD